MQPEVYLKVLERAAKSCGGVPGVALLLNASREEVADWLSRRAAMPTIAFLRLVDHLVEIEAGEAQPPVRIVPRPPALVPVVRQIAEQALDEALALHGTELGNVQLLNARGNLQIAAQRGFGPAFLEFFHEVSADDVSVCGQALASGERIVVSDVLSDPELSGTSSQAAILAAGVRSVQSTPLVSAAGRVFGMISTHFREPGGAHDGLPSLAPIARRFADMLQTWTPPALQRQLREGSRP
jgi:GAF domain-containing protein